MITILLDFLEEIGTFWGLSLKIPFVICQWHQFALVWEEVGEESRLPLGYSTWL